MYSLFNTLHRLPVRVASLLPSRKPSSLLITALKILSRSQHKFTVSVEGNIGSGKSTLLYYLSKKLDVDVIPEPVHKWQNFRGVNLLEKVYMDPHNWAFVFQSYVQKTMVENHLADCGSPVKLMERSIYSARFCFVENLYSSGRLTEAEYLVYCKWFKAFTRYLDCSVDLIVYLRTDPLIAHKRIASRARFEEQMVAFEYCRDLHQRYEAWIGGSEVPAPVLVIDANEGLHDLRYKYNIVMEIIENSVKAAQSC
ncbi:thymidine kinase 2, mitochondrial-like [Macrobrachium nipponense]|uniref:thymidine kinase 2, mitochondrial-like n=1 Tax=Macrobrachium nipponense TaxID=159736 RepID=UPI0030C87AAE